MRILAAWIGNADLNGSRIGDGESPGPIAAAVEARAFDRLLLLSDQDDLATQQYVRWLSGRTSAVIDLERVELSSPTNMKEIYQGATRALDRVLALADDSAQLTMHLSPGTPAMAAVWVLLGKTRYPAEFLESSVQAGVRAAEVPFDISAELLPAIFAGPDLRLAAQSAETAPGSAVFGDITFRSDSMRRVVDRAKRAAGRSVPILIEGESGTGKELLAKSIVNHGPRKFGPFRVVNCGAIPSELIEAELFGHVKGAYTGATRDRAGYFEEADGGTLFLDEIGELPLSAQVKLLRVIQEGEVTRVGATQAKRINTRIIAATNRNLAAEAAAGRFRADLFYRLAVLVLRLPPLTAREGDIGLLIDELLQRINAESLEEPGYIEKQLAPGARRVLLARSWPGNVRELQNTLRRAAVWTDGGVISEDDIRDALFTEVPGAGSEREVLGPIGDGVNLRQIISGVKRHYLEEALAASGGNKSKAARLVGLASPQVFSAWFKKYVESAD
jgi:DNA-binding NtrC family response regulator